MNERKMNMEPEMNEELDQIVNVPLYRHQKAAVEFAMKRLLSHGGAALLMEMGTGKTLTAITIAGRLRKLGLVHRVLVIAPLSVLGVWRDEFERYAAFDYTLCVLTGSTKAKEALLEGLHGPGMQIAVVNYESCWRMDLALDDWMPDLMICDEGHRIKNARANASKSVHMLAMLTQYRLLLTGTVIVNKPIDVFSQYKFVDREIFGNSFYQFRNRYFNMVGYGNYTPVMKPWMRGEFTKKLHDAAFRVTKAECLDLPETTDVIQRIDLEIIPMQLYQDLVQDSVAQLMRDEVTTTNVLTMLLRLSQLTGGFLTGDQTGNVEQVSRAKLDALKELIEDAMENGEKVVVIARFVPEINAIGALMEKMGIRYAQISGGVTDRDEQVKAFQEDPECRVFVGQIATAGLGITLTAARIMVFYSLDYSMANYEQARARIHRVGQTQACTYVHLIARGTVDERVIQALRDKVDIAKRIVDEVKGGMMFGKQFDAEGGGMAFGAEVTEGAAGGRAEERERRDCDCGPGAIGSDGGDGYTELYAQRADLLSVDEAAGFGQGRDAGEAV